MKELLAGIALLFGLSGTAHATLIEMVFDFKGGFSASFNGGANAPTGPLTFRVLLDSATPDLIPDDFGWGNFAAKSVELAAPSLGLADERVVVPDLTVLMGQASILIRSVSAELQLGGGVGETLMSIMSNVNDLTTLALPTVATIKSTFFLGTIAFQNGDTLSGDIGFGGPPAVFSAAAVPEPTILAFLSLALAGFYFARRYRLGLSSASGHGMDV